MIVSALMMLSAGSGEGGGGAGRREEAEKEDSYCDGLLVRARAGR